MDYATGIVQRAMEHKLKRKPDGNFLWDEGWLHCGTCGLDVYTKDQPATVFEGERAEMGHQLYTAVTETTERVAKMVRLRRDSCRTS